MLLFFLYQPVLLVKDQLAVIVWSMSQVRRFLSSEIQGFLFILCSFLKMLYFFWTLPVSSVHELPSGGPGVWSTSHTHRRGAAGKEKGSRMYFKIFQKHNFQLTPCSSLSSVVGVIVHRFLHPKNPIYPKARLENEIGLLARFSCNQPLRLRTHNKSEKK